MLNNLLDEFLALSDNLRHGYSASLSKSKEGWEEAFRCIFSTAPDFYKLIYGKVSGTKRGIKRQDLMDFTPGYRLIHIDELKAEKSSLDSIVACFDIRKYDLIMPLLGNYSSDYVCYLKTIVGHEHIGFIAHDNPAIEIMHTSAVNFLTTLCEFYKQGVYFLDNDGFLDYDFEKERDIGRAFNANVGYWA